MANIVSTMHKVDCHSHILPGVDDGSKTVEESLDILKQFKSQGVETILATPHFYPDDKIEEFLEKREAAYEQLMAAISQEKSEAPNIKRGAEVLLSVDTPRLPDLDKLCIEGTRYILIELPYARWQEWVYEALYTIRAKHGLIPLLAHIERYERTMGGLDKLHKLMELDVVVQMNAYSLIGTKKAYAFKLVKNNMVHVLGSDAHRARTAKGVAVGYEAIAKKLGKDQAEKLTQNAQCVLEGKMVEKESFKPIKKVWKWYI